MPATEYRLPEEVVAELPRRTAHALYALLAYARDKQVTGPFYAHEIVFYDPEATSTRSTGRALGYALKLGLVDRYGEGLWWATNKTHTLRRALEERVLAEQKESES